MKIVCPSCDATYEVPDIVVTSRRKMRCARCTTDWVPGDQLATAAPEPALDMATQRPPAGVAPVAAQEAGGPMAPEAAPVREDPAVPAGFETPLDGLVSEAAPHAAPPEAPEPEVAQPGRRDDEPYQLALRPETHVSVFPASPKLVPPSASPRPTPRASKAPVAVAWAASIVILAAAIAGFLTYRVPVMKAWPPSVRLYAALGLTRP